MLQKNYAGLMETLSYMIYTGQHTLSILVLHFLAFKIVTFIYILISNKAPAWNTTNAAKKLCRPNGNLKLYIETTVAPAIHINTLTHSCIM